jgi:tetratricopeptide (TPR) repeat protein
LPGCCGDCCADLTGSATIDFNVARLYERKGEYAQAGRWLDSARRRSRPQDGLDRMAVVLLERQGRFDEAIDLARSLLAERPDFARLRDELAMLLIRAGRPDEAIDVCRRGLSIDPDNLLALIRLSLLLFDRGELAEATALTRKTVALDPNNPMRHVALAFVLAEAGEIDEAMSSMRRALELDPNNETIQRNMARLRAQFP